MNTSNESEFSSSKSFHVSGQLAGVNAQMFYYFQLAFKAILIAALPVTFVFRELLGKMRRNLRKNNENFGKFEKIHPKIC